MLKYKIYIYIYIYILHSNISSIYIASVAYIFLYYIICYIININPSLTSY